MTLEHTKDKSKVKKGIQTAVDIITCTMGGKGKQVAISDTRGNLQFTKDGVTVAEALELQDPIENIGAQLVINSARKTVDQCGDGTTTTSLLFGEFTNLDTEFKELEPIVDLIQKNLTTLVKKVESPEQIRSIASISANDKTIGDLYFDVYSKIGLDSKVNLHVDEDALETYFQIHEGVTFRSGYLSPRFANQKNKYCVFENPFIIIDKDKMSNMEVYFKACQKALKQETPIVFISPEFSREVIDLTVTNMRQGLQVCLIKSPGYGKQVQENYKDIYSCLNKDQKAKRISITPVDFTITPAEDNTIEERINDVRELLNGFIEDYDRVKIPQRIHSLQGTTASIYVGGTTAKNASEEFDRIEDALGAVEAAISSGYVIGGGLALAEAAKNTVLEDLCCKPAYKIKQNANLKENLNQVDVTTGKEVDYLKEGIIDPYLVVSKSLENAFASYKLYQQTEHIIHNEAKSIYQPLG